MINPTNDYQERLNQALQEFDATASNLALHQTLEYATQANIASLKWADLFYQRKNGEIAPEQVQRYVADITACIGVLDRIKHRMQRYEKETWSKQEIEEKRRPSSHVGGYIDQMRQRIRLVHPIE